MSFASVVLDADSTLAGIEGVDWLAGLRGREVEERVAGLTADAMAGLVPLESVYERRLALIAPTRAEVGALARAYVDAAAPGALEAVAALRAAGVALRMVSGGLRPALLPLALHLGLDEGEVVAVDVRFDHAGRWGGLGPSPLTTGDGKRLVARALALPRPVLAVGDGATDLAMRPEVDAFAAYVGYVRREAVAGGADVVVASFEEVARLALGAGAP